MSKQREQQNKMKKIIAIASLFTAFATAANAQTVSATATQTVNLNLTDVISISFVSSGSSTGAAVNLPFTTVTDYANGVTSADQQMVVMSNKHFNVSVQTNAVNFTYTGPVSPAPAVQISNVLQMMVTANNTGGSLSYSTYSSISSGAGTIINYGSAGGNQTFSVKYKANPGFSLPGGTYTANVVYTATQL